MGNSGKFLFGFWLGALAGATAALLMTPYSGEETRRQLQERGIELKGQVQTQAERLAEEARVRAQQTASEVREQLSQAEERGHVVLTEGIKKAQQVVDRTEDAANKAADEASAA